MPKIAEKELRAHLESGDNCGCSVEPNGQLGPHLPPCPLVLAPVRVSRKTVFDFLCARLLSLVALLCSLLVFSLINNWFLIGVCVGVWSGGQLSGADSHSLRVPSV